ncbi:alpha/beta fold hydrolase [Usitatibacter palustris]|uniref:Fluoroacetate dehalogenase n=1 Tax=Usitatibacter palustris TaxID=2732487 RepID=A0A6M4H9P1_9PROT|nr:alpha/beta hydrolase [Usitatibacter palustris]QJR15114.1 Fluoroacetate dehalogenase [Usitatibacter palustris]
MDIIKYARVTGRGTPLLCLHSSGASSRQWDRLALRLADRFRVIAVDFGGHGKRPGWAANEEPSLQVEAEALRPLLASAPEGMHVVAHSYGAAVALKLALDMPERIRSLAVYEPVLFRLIYDGFVHDRAGEEVVAAGTAICNTFHAGDVEESAYQFVDFWSGAGTFARLDDKQRVKVLERMSAVVDHFHALFNDDTAIEEFRTLRVPTLLMNGTLSPACGRSITRRLALALPSAWRHEFAGLGHLGPITRPDDVNSAIEQFLAGVTARHSLEPARFAFAA